MIRILAVMVALSGALLASPKVASAQARPDSAAVLLEAAKRFEARGDIGVADALMRMILERYGDTPAADEVRAMRAAMPADRGARSGSVELAVWSTLYGFWLGVAIPAAGGADGPEPYGLGLLVGGPLGFFAGRGYARSRNLTEGQARAITWGGSWGTWQGLGWTEVFEFGVRTEESCIPSGPCEDVEIEDNLEERFGAMVVGGLTGILAGAIISRKPISAGVATTVNFGSLWGTWYGVATAVLANMEGDDAWAAALVGGNLGLFTTAMLAPRWQLTRNRARLISIAGVVGGLGGAGIDLLIQPDDEKVAIAIPLITSTIGLAVGAATTRNSEADRNGEDGAGGAALLNIDGGHVALDVPQPLPMMLPVDHARGRSWQPALGLTLLSARF